MLETFNDYISLGVLIFIILFFVYIFLKHIFNTVERARIKKDMINRIKEQQGQE